ncbi:thioesterase family protein [Nocardia sp. alder85J]|uniref:thioesterase family protein n=1 Tax=Nocardia sp. alder85J TaxID=2862949 RepID=UPI001CD662EE|nr:thioesterase family protein [Nocardia sp. alder85J]MCX4091896.1 thioesterase family protein [Nocardia sp. alder85J]
MVAFFTAVDGRYEASPFAVARWSPRQIGGHAVCGLLARELEKHCPDAEFVPARLTVDLFMPVVNDPIAVRAEVVRRGNRIVVADARIEQDGEVRARATAVFLRTGDTPPGRIWRSAHTLPDPPEPTDRDMHLVVQTGADDWTPDFGACQNAERKTIWQHQPPLVAGEPTSAFQRAAIVGDTTNMVCNWGSQGVGYINSDMTLTLSRLPEGPELGLQAADHVAHDGISVGTATLYDRLGRVGTCVVTAVSNSRRQLDFARITAEHAAAHR